MFANSTIEERGHEGGYNQVGTQSKDGEKGGREVRLEEAVRKLKS